MEPCLQMNALEWFFGPAKKAKLAFEDEVTGVFPRPSQWDTEYWRFKEEEDRLSLELFGEIW
jgi:hypothetical protein